MKKVKMLKYIRNIDSLSDEELKSHGYYRGFVCPHNHNIRSLENHSCYKCLLKIYNNMCGYNINFLAPQYKHRLRNLIKTIDMKDFDSCWESPRGDVRIRLPSYRSNEKRPTDNVRSTKAIYAMAWGDIGKFQVNRICRNRYCLNPLHLYSSLNFTLPPEFINPFVNDFIPNELCQYMELKKRNKLEDHFKTMFKNTISSPFEMINAQNNDEYCE